MTSNNRTSRTTATLSIVILALLVFSKIILTPLGDLDELWNYNLCRGVSMGFIPYKDFPMVMMPLFTLLFSIPLLVVKKLIIYRIASAVFLLIIALVFYFNASEMIGPLWGLAASCLYAVFINVATYNALLFLMVLLIYRIMSCKMTKGRAFTAGTLCALAILSRQTSGVFLTFAIIAVFLLLRDLRKHLAFLMAGGTVICLAFLVYLLATGSFEAFWDCCLFALLGKDKNAAFVIDSVPSLIICIGGIISSFFLWKKEKDRNHIYYLILGCILLTIAIPIMDMMHASFSALWFVIPLFKLVKNYCKDRINPGTIKLITALIIGLIMIRSCFCLLGTELSDNYDEFVLIPTNRELLDSYATINETNNTFRQSGKKVVVYSSTSCIISILNGDFNPPYDLFLKGNIGTTDPVAFAEADSKRSNTIIVIPADYDSENWENPQGVYDCITKNCTPIASYGRYTWYLPST